jgi:hypothetical protein
MAQINRSGLAYIIELYNFINSDLTKNDLLIRVNKDENNIGSLEFTQDGIWTMLPDFLNEVIVVPNGFRSGRVSKKDLIKLYNDLSYICDRDGRVPDYLTNSIPCPEIFGFSVYSRYPISPVPGAHFIQSFKFKVRYNKLIIWLRDLKSRVRIKLNL